MKEQMEKAYKIFDVAFLIGIIVFLILFILTMFTPVHAAEISIHPTYNHYFNEGVESGPGLKVTGSWDWFRVWGSWQHSCRTEHSQELGRLDLFGIGVGVRERLTPRLFITWDVGYYYPSINTGTSQYDAMYLFIVNQLPMNPVYSRYNYEVSGNIGGALGLRYQRGHWFLSTSYTYLRCHERISAFHSTGFVSFPRYVDYSHFSLGLGVTF